MDNKNVWTDGSCLGNGTSKPLSGFAVYYGHQDERNYASALGDTKPTNNKAELCAILYAIVMNFKTSDMIIYTDSMYSVTCITEYVHKWKTRGWTTSRGSPVESAETIKYISREMEKRKAMGLVTTIVHVKAHSDCVENNTVDDMARKAAASGRVTPRVRFMRRCGIPI